MNDVIFQENYITLFLTLALIFAQQELFRNDTSTSHRSESAYYGITHVVQAWCLFVNLQEVGSNIPNDDEVKV